jgi:hypothetical protein
MLNRVASPGASRSLLAFTTLTWIPALPAAGFGTRLNCFDLPKLPADKNTSGSFHRNAGERWKGCNARKTAVTTDCTKVRSMRGGNPE